MGNVVSFYKLAGKKKRENKKRDFKTTREGHPLLFLNLFLTRNQANMLKRIFTSQFKVHADHRKDYVMVLKSTLKALNQTTTSSGACFSIHVYEIYYFEQIIDFEMDMYKENYNMLDMLIIEELTDMINSFKENNKEYITEFTSITGSEKHRVLTEVFR